MKPRDSYYKSIIGISSKGDLLKNATERFPSFSPSALDAIAHIHRVSKEWDAHTSARLERANLSLGKLYALIFLFGEETCGRPSAYPSEIAEALGVTRPTVSSLLDGLERDGYIDREPNIDDRRALNVSLTDRAREFLDRYIPEHCERMNRLFGGLMESDRASLIGLLQRIDVSAVAEHR